MKLAIYQTSDLHGYVYPTNYVKDQPLGILKIGSYILNDEKNYDASLKVDCGDLIQGSALAHYLSKEKLDKNPILEGLEFIGYDAYVIGNHEFNYGLDYLNNSYNPVYLEDKEYLLLSQIGNENEDILIFRVDNIVHLSHEQE